MAKVRCWLGVVSKEHVDLGKKGGFAQVCHGKRAPLSKMSTGDWLIYYSPKESMDSDVRIQTFTAIGKIEDEDVFQVNMGHGFVPFRRRVQYSQSAKTVPINSLKDQLNLLKDQNWGFRLRQGLIELDKDDFRIIAHAMLGKVPKEL